jgi:hypothetical protein
MPTFTGNSPRWAIFNTLATALETAPDLQGVPVRRNPPVAIPLKKGDYVVAVFWGRDAFVARKGNDDQRSFQIIVGSMVSTDASDRDADAMHLVATEVLSRAMPGLNSLEGAREVLIKEDEVSPELEKPLIEGAMVLSAYTVTYRQPSFNRPRA